MTSIPSRPRTRNDFRVAIICALPLEARMVTAVFDKNWRTEGVTFDQAENDDNTYTLGAIGKHNVVLVHMPWMGSTAGATAVTNLRWAFPSIHIAFVVGICGASPKHIATKQEICLGDCIVSTALVQYGFGRQYPGFFSRKIDVEDVLGKAGTAIGSLLAKLQATEDLKGELAQHLQILKERDPRAHYPGAQKDRLYDSAYLHVHRDIAGRCDHCVQGSMVCTKTCSQIGCDGAQPRASLVPYENAQKEYLPRVHFGRYGSADMVLKSGTDRDEYTRVDKIVAFEMEAAGIWDVLPTVVVKSACDYADSHKNKDWQDYAAATAAAGLKAILEYWRVVDVLLRSDSMNEAVKTDLGVAESIREADKLIRNHYLSGDRLLIKRLSGQELDLEKCYINLALIDRLIQTRDEEQKSSFSLEARLRLEASGTGQSIFLEDLFEPRKLASGKTVGPRRIFIQGRAGIGKTTLCKKIVSEFLEGRLASRLFDRLLWIPLRGLKSDQNDYGWHDLLQSTFRMSNHTWKDAKDIYAKQFDKAAFLSRTLFLFDGLDEISQQWKDEDPFYSFLKTILCGLPNIIITSRPQVNAFSLESFDLDLETVGFTSDQVSTYIKICVNDTTIATDMERIIAQKPLLRGLLRIPVQLDAFCYSWNEGEAADAPDTEDGITMTTLYRSITTELCRKDLKLLARLDQPRQTPSFQVEENFKGELSLLGEIAFQGLLNSVADFNPQHWDTLGNHLYRSMADFSAIFSSTLDRLSFLRTSDYGKDYTKRNYHFIHLTFQEFFAARHFVEHWQHDRPLTCLQLTGRSKTDDKTPLVFLQEEKYNPRYNIFWRFVAGLLADRHDVIGFFAQLHNEPVDLLGATHRRLLMYCLSEVASDGDGELEQLYDREVDLLEQGLLKEYRLTPDTRLGAEMEFPEKVLRRLLENDNKLPYTQTLSTLGRRSVLQVQTAEAIARKLTPGHATEVQLAAAQVLWDNTVICSEQTLRLAIDILKTTLRDGDPHMRDSAASVLKGQSSLSETAITALIAASKDKDHYVRQSAARILEAQSSLSEAAVDTLITLLEDKVSHVRRSAARALGKQSSLSEAAVTALTVLLKDEERWVRAAAVSVILKQSSLPAATITSLFALLKDEDRWVRAAAACALAKESSLSEAAIDALIAAFKDEDIRVRVFAAQALGNQSSLSEAALDALSAAFKDEDSRVRSSAARALGKQSSLSEAALDALLALLKHEDWRVRSSAALALREPSSPSEAGISTLIALLKDEDKDVRSSAASALGKQSSLSEAAVNGLLALLEDEDKDVRRSAEQTLRQQPSLSDAALDALLALLKHKDSHVRSSAAEALRGQSSLSAVIDVLLVALKDKDKDVRWSAARTLGQQPSLSEAAIDALIAAFKDENQQVQSSAAEALKAQSSLSEAALDALVALLKHKDRNVRWSAIGALAGQSSLSDAAISVLVSMLAEDEVQSLQNILQQRPHNYNHVQNILQQQPHFYSLIPTFESQIWRDIWACWLSSGIYSDVSCYEFAGALYVWSNGVRHTIFTDAAQTAQFRRAVLSLPENLSGKRNVSTDTMSESSEILPEVKIAKPKSESKARSRLKFWKK